MTPVIRLPLLAVRWLNKGLRAGARSREAGGLGAGTTRGRAGEARLEAHPQSPDLAIQYEHAPPPQLPASAAPRSFRLPALLPQRGVASGAQQLPP